MLPAAWKVSTKGLLWQVTIILLVESSACPTCLRLSFIDFYSAECPPLGRRYRKRVDAQLSCKLMTVEYDTSATVEHLSVRKSESLTSFMMESNRWYLKEWCIQVKNGVHVNSINHYVYLIVLRTTITVVVSNKQKQKKSHFIRNAGYVQVYYLITVDQLALLEHWDMLCSNLDGKRLFKSQSCRRNSKKKMKWEIKWRKLLRQNKHRNKCANIREED